MQTGTVQGANTKSNKNKNKNNKTETAHNTESKQHFMSSVAI